MAVYDSSVVISCINSEDSNSDNCQMILNDDDCIIVPTVYEEVSKWRFKRGEEIKKEIRNMIFSKCTVFEDYDNDIFKDHVTDINAFATDIYYDWLKGNVKGRGFFKHKCRASGKIEHALNDYKIIKEANVIGEEKDEVVDFVTGDVAQARDVCVKVYKYEMEEVLDEPFMINPILVKTHD